MSLFYELIQVALGRKDKLSHTPQEDVWVELFHSAQKQSLAGVAFYAVDKLSQQGQKPPVQILYEWIGLSEQIRQKNRLMNKRCHQLQHKLSEKDVRSSILKGQGVAQYYDEPLQELRQPGDIDVYVDCGRKRAIEVAKQFGMENPRWDYKHLHLAVWSDTEVEVHYRVEVLLNLWKNRKLQRWFEAHRKEIFDETEKGGLTTPSISFNLFYILLHIYRHFLYEGVGLRQLMDYYFVLRRSNSTDAAGITETLKEFGMMRFARGVMWVMQEVFGLEKEKLYCEPLASEGRFILQEVMAGGNFGHFDSRLQKGGGKVGTLKAVCKHNWHLVSHYPNDVVWAPVWFVWHKCWKLAHR